MKYLVWIAPFAVLAVLATGQGVDSARASDAVVLIHAAGGAYQGPPKLRLLADGRIVGERTFNKTIDTASGEKLTKANRAFHAEWLKFAVPAIEDIKELEIEFFNEAWEGKGKPGSRKIFVFGVVIDGYLFRPLLMRPMPSSAGGAWRGQAMLWANGRLQLYRPAKGWRSGYKAAAPRN
jgi:hypothetical protein